MTIPDLQKALDRLKPSDPQFAVQAVDTVLAAARASGASDVHWQPTAEGMSVRFRIDGVLQPVHMLPAAAAPNLAARLKVIAGLLTYRTDFPQEGRMRTAPRTEEKQRNGPAVPSREAGETILTANETEMRVSTFPTLHGERVVVRLFGRRQDFQFPADLGLPDDILATLTRLLGETSGAILVSGPAGSGKTTTVYACMRELLRQHPCRSLVSIEDPVEAELPGVGQAQVHANVGLDLATGLRFLMRQDPEVIMVGEIRDRATADAAMQASLTGHLLLSTFHAGSAAETVGRLLDMGIEPYVLRSGLMAILNQRLLRRLCTCAEECANDPLRLGLDVQRFCLPAGCTLCSGTGYSGRLLLTELLIPGRGRLARAILTRQSAARLERIACAGGMRSRWTRAEELVAAGLTDPAEVRRVLGFSDSRDGHS